LYPYCISIGTAFYNDRLGRLDKPSMSCLVSQIHCVQTRFGSADPAEPDY